MSDVAQPQVIWVDGPASGMEHPFRVPPKKWVVLHVGSINFFAGVLPAVGLDGKPDGSLVLVVGRRLQSAAPMESLEGYRDVSMVALIRAHLGTEAPLEQSSTATEWYLGLHKCPTPQEAQRKAAASAQTSLNRMIGEQRLASPGPALE